MHCGFLCLTVAFCTLVNSVLAPILAELPPKKDSDDTLIQKPTEAEGLSRE